MFRAAGCDEVDLRTARDQEGHMQLEGHRDLAAPVDDVRRRLHDPDVVGRVVPGCQELAPVGPDHLVVVLGFAAGRLADRYRGMLTVQDTEAGFRATLDAHGRTGGLNVDVRAFLTALDAGRTRLRWTAQVQLDGLAARAVTSSVEVVGHQLAGQVFQALDRALAETPVPA
jgi:carbon monoxide dehydrogenase subunit G